MRNSCLCDTLVIVGTQQLAACDVETDDHVVDGHSEGCAKPSEHKARNKPFVVCLKKNQRSAVILLFGEVKLGKNMEPFTNLRVILLRTNGPC